MEVLDILRKVERRGRLDTARRLRSTISCVFRYAIATGLAEHDPTYALRGALTAPQTTPRAAITRPEALGGLLRAIDEYDGQPITKAALQLLPILFPRPGELRFAEWPEFDFDKAIWMIPAEHTKMRRARRDWFIAVEETNRKLGPGLMTPNVCAPASNANAPK